MYAMHTSFQNPRKNTSYFSMGAEEEEEEEDLT
jgi:hypothetical protein